MGMKSLKEQAMDKILDKMSTGRGLTPNEAAFMAVQGPIPDSDLRDFMLVSSFEACTRVASLLDHGLRVTCNLRDRDGVIGDDVVSSSVTGDRSTITLAGRLTIELLPSFLYDLTFSMRDFRYSLESDHEFYELAPIKN